LVSFREVLARKQDESPYYILPDDICKKKIILIFPVIYLVEFKEVNKNEILKEFDLSNVEFGLEYLDLFLEIVK
jgi:hypothetical protein